MYTIGKTFDFSASHALKHLPEGHPCHRLHGHNYSVMLTLANVTLDELGMVVDYGKLAEFRDYLNESYDHQHLNDVMDRPPTAENIARQLYDWARQRWPQTLSVMVSETDKTFAEYGRDD